MPEDTNRNELEVLQQIIASLAAFDRDTQVRMLETAVTWLQIDGVKFTRPSGGFSLWDMATRPPEQTEPAQPVEREQRFSDRPDASPKEFLLDKEPRTDGERVACLAFYLTHYRNMAEFKTLDLS